MYLIMRRTYHYAFMFLLFGMGCDSNDRGIMVTTAPMPSLDQSFDDVEAPLNLDELSLGAGLSLDVGYDFPTEEELKALEKDLRNQDYFYVAVNYVEEQFNAIVQSVKTVSFTAILEAS